jgi:FkbH-like protein
MKSVQRFADLLALDGLPQLRAEAARWPNPLTLQQARELTARAQALSASKTDLRVAVVHTYTSDLLDPWLVLAGALCGMTVHTYHAPYGVPLSEARPNSALESFAPDVTLFLLRREDLHPALTWPVVGLDADEQARTRAESTERLQSIVAPFRARQVGHLVITILPAMLGPALASFDAQFERSEARWWTNLTSDVAGWLRDNVASSLFLDLEEVLDQVGRRRFFDPRFWYTARFPFSAEAAQEIARRVVNVGVVLKSPRAKVIVLDADNTLWGGIIGEDGMGGIALGQDHPGAEFSDFQRRLLDFRQRGMILALCSKNNPADLMQVLREHPHQILREKDFAAMRVNWSPKAQNLISLAAELNVGLESFIFVDDSAHECDAIRTLLPQVEVVQTPHRPTDVPGCLEHVGRLEVLSLTSEDIAKTQLYVQERQRRELSEEVAASGATADDYLRRLGMRMEVYLNPSGHIARLSQLTQKTNQFNLTTRRYDEQRVKQFILDDRWLVMDFSLADIFGDSGIVGLAFLRLHDDEEAELDTFLMSCRVIGREAEAAFLHAILRTLAMRGFGRVVADFHPTRKNELARSFLPSQGFQASDDGRFRRDLRACPPAPENAFPILVEIHGVEAAPENDTTHSTTTAEAAG